MITKFISNSVPRKVEDILEGDKYRKQMDLFRYLAYLATNLTSISKVVYTHFKFVILLL